MSELKVPAQAQKPEYAIEQNEQGLFVVCEVPCQFLLDVNRQLEQENLDELEIMNDEKLADLEGQPADFDTNVAADTEVSDAGSAAGIGDDSDAEGMQPIYTAHFDFNESNLVPEALSQLEGFFVELSSGHESQPRKVLLKGFTDDIGPEAYNLNLASQRVAKVAEVLAYLGFEIVEGQAHGKCCYLASNETPEGRQANRRVEVFFINNQEEVNDDANQ